MSIPLPPSPPPTQGSRPLGITQISPGLPCFQTWAHTFPLGQECPTSTWRKSTISGPSLPPGTRTDHLARWLRSVAHGLPAHQGPTDSEPICLSPPPTLSSQRAAETPPSLEPQPPGSEQCFPMMGYMAFVGLNSGSGGPKAKEVAPLGPVSLAQQAGKSRLSGLGFEH